MTISTAYAQELPSPRLLPDNLFYGLSRWFEGVRMFFTFDEEAKARLNLHFSELRLAEAKIMIERGKTEFAEGLMRDYRWELNESQKRLRAQRQLGRNVTLLAEHIANATNLHIEVLEKILEKVPDQAKPAIEHAINVSSRGCIEALKIIREGTPEIATEIGSRFAEKELNRFQERVREQKREEIQRRLERYEEYLNETEEATEEVEGLGKNVTILAEHVCNMTYKHIEVLQEVLEKVPEQAKPAIEHAINVSVTGHENCMDRIFRIMNRTLEQFRFRNCTSVSECEGIYCPEEFEYEIRCLILPNRTQGVCRCLPKWERVSFNCTADADCRHLICPMVIGSDTPICEANRCICGARWRITNTTEWQKRFGEELTSETQRIMEGLEERHRIRSFAV